MINKKFIEFNAECLDRVIIKIFMGLTITILISMTIGGLSLEIIKMADSYTLAYVGLLIFMVGVWLNGGSS